MSAPQEIMMHEVGRRVSVTPILWSHRHDRLRLCVMFFWGIGLGDSRGVAWCVLTTRVGNGRDPEGGRDPGIDDVRRGHASTDRLRGILRGCGVFSSRGHGLSGIGYRRGGATCLHHRKS